MTKNLVCNECGGGMQEGYVLDTMHGGWLQSSWIKGKPEKSIWVGLKTMGKTRYYISAYRCENCGFLKFFAESDGSNK